MANLTIRNLDDRLKACLRIRAASRGRSMEEEARQILRTALDQPQPESANLAESIRRRFAKLGDVQLPITNREPARCIEMPEDVAANGKTAASTRRATKARRRP